VGVHLIGAATGEFVIRGRESTLFAVTDTANAAAPALGSDSRLNEHSRQT
jgi:hypothetical protein